MIFLAKTKCPQDRMSPLFTLVCRFPGCQIDRAKSPHSCNLRLINRCWNWKQIVVIRNRQSKTWFSASMQGFLNAQSQNFVCTHKRWRRAHSWKEKVQKNKTDHTCHASAFYVSDIESQIIITETQVNRRENKEGVRGQHFLYEPPNVNGGVEDLAGLCGSDFFAARIRIPMMGGTQG